MSVSLPRSSIHQILYGSPGSPPNLVIETVFFVTDYLASAVAWHKKSKTEHHRKVLEEMAKAWEQLADESDRRPPGPRDSHYLFARFELMRQQKKRT
jgi:hypothetical protein